MDTDLVFDYTEKPLTTKDLIRINNHYQENF